MKYLAAIAFLTGFAAQAAAPQAADVSARAVVQSKDGAQVCTLAVIARVQRGDTHLLISGALSAQETGLWRVKGAYFEAPQFSPLPAGPKIKTIRSFWIQAVGQTALARSGYVNIKTDDVSIMYFTPPEPAKALVRAIVQRMPVQLSVLDLSGTTETFSGVAEMSEAERNEMLRCMADLGMPLDQSPPAPR